MKNLILAILAVSGLATACSKGLADDFRRFSNQRLNASPRRTAHRTQTRGMEVARHQRHSVKYHLDEMQTRKFYSHSLAHRWANYVRSLGATIKLSEIAGRFYVRYEMRGRRTRRFHNHPLAHSFERRLEAIGFHARVTRF